MKIKLGNHGKLVVFSSCVGICALLTWAALQRSEHDPLRLVETRVQGEAPKSRVPQARAQQADETTKSRVSETHVRQTTATTDNREQRATPKVNPHETHGTDKVDTTNQIPNPTAKPGEMKVANSLERNPHLSSRLTPLLPARVTLTDAATGFKNQRQFIAALHLSKNLGIAFDQLKTRMTVEPRRSLDDSLRELSPDMGKNLVRAEVDKAEAQAKDDEQLAKVEAKKAAADEKLSANNKS